MGVRVVLAEDNLLVLEGVVSLLAGVADVDVVATCRDLDGLLEAVDMHEPDLLVTDIRMPPTHTDEGIRAAAELRARAPEIGVLVLSQFVEPAYALDLLAAGTRGRGYLLKEHVDDIDRLVVAIHTVAAGGSYVDDEVVDALIRGRSRRDGSPLEWLSGREREVLATLATGSSNAAIARTLCISEHSVEKHCSAIFSKLGLTEDSDLNRRVAAVLLFLSDRSS